MRISGSRSEVRLKPFDPPPDEEGVVVAVVPLAEPDDPADPADRSGGQRFGEAVEAKRLVP